MHDHTSMDIEQTQITGDTDLSPEQCKQASERKSPTLFDNKPTVEKGKTKTPYKWKRNVNGDDVNECKGYE